MDGINGLNYTNHLLGIGFKGYNKADDAASVTNPVKVKNVSMNGAEALASYNYAMLNKNNIFDMKLVKPLEIPQNLNNIKGEKIYDSNRNLVAIVDDNNENKAEYRITDGKVVYYNIVNKKTGEELSGNTYLEDNSITASMKTPDGNWYSTEYDSDGNAIYLNKDVKTGTSENDYVMTNYRVDEKEYNVLSSYKKEGNEYVSTAEFDSSKNCVAAYDSSADGEMTYIHFYNGIPIGKTISKTDSTGKISINNIDLSEMEPAKCPDINMEYIKTLNGKNTYYSNGELERLEAEDGNTYLFNYAGGLEKIINNSTEIEIMRGERDLLEITGVEITEKFPDGATKETDYDLNNNFHRVIYRKGDSEKFIVYENGYPDIYTETTGNHEKWHRFDKNGDLIEFHERDIE